MPSVIRVNSQRVVVLGTGGTIAGTAADPADSVGYTAAQRGVAQLVAAVPALGAVPLDTEQVAQLDSKDMDAGTWQRLARRAQHHLDRAEVCGVVVTHGTDTLEETAFLLHQVLDTAHKPVVLTAAMRPATAMGADGPQNLLDAVALACEPGAQGVLAVLGGQVHAGMALRKQHPYRVQAFSSGDQGLLGWMEEGRIRRLQAWPEGPALGVDLLDMPPADWPWVEVLASHATARPDAVRALVAAGLRGLVVAATGNGSVHQTLEPALVQAAAAGVAVWRCSRCGDGTLVGPVADGQPAAALTPWQARTALMLALMAGSARA